MNNQAGSPAIGPAAKKGIILAILLIALALFAVVLLSGRGPKTAKIIGEGDKAPDFTLVSLDGRQVSLSSLKGKVVILHFWATWCPPCVEEIPTLDSLYRKLDGNIVLLAASVDEGGAGAVGNFLQRRGLSLPVLLDSNHAVASLYGTTKFPETYVIDGSGIVKYKIIGPEDWTEPRVLKALQDLAAGR